MATDEGREGAHNEAAEEEDELVVELDAEALEQGDVEIDLVQALFGDDEDDYELEVAFDEDSERDAHGPGCECGCEETFELEISEEDIVRYVVDEDGNQVGIVVMEDGQEVEYELAEDDEEDVFELEVSEDDIEYYLVDEDGTEVGFVVVEDGQEVEYFYAEDDDETAGAKGDKYDLGITRENVAQTTSDLNSIYRDGKAIADEFSSAFDDINSAFDFMQPKKGSSRRRRR